MTPLKIPANYSSLRTQRPDCSWGVVMYGADKCILAFTYCPSLKLASQIAATLGVGFKQNKVRVVITAKTWLEQARSSEPLTVELLP